MNNDDRDIPEPNFMIDTGDDQYYDLGFARFWTIYLACWILAVVVILSD